MLTGLRSRSRVKQFHRIILCSICFAILYPIAVFCQVSVEKAPIFTTLDSGNPVERELSIGQKHSYQMTLTEGQFAGVELDARGINATITLFDTAGEVIIAYPAEPGMQTLDLVAEATGRYRIEIESKPSAAPNGTYTIRLPAPRPAPDEELWRHQARRLSHKANALIQAGKYEEAKGLAEKALELRMKALGPDHIGVANSLTMLANINSSRGDYPAAEPLYLRALAINEKTSGPSSIGVFRILNNLGALYLRTGDLDKAEQFMTRCLEIQEKLSGADQTMVAYALHNLATVYKLKNDYGKAEPLYERALAINEKAFGPDHPRVTGALSGLASLYELRGDYVKAESFYQRVLPIREKAFGAEHDVVADTLLDLAILHYRAAELEKAELLYGRALQIYEKAFGGEHPRVALALNNLGVIHHDRGDFAKAETLHQRALDIRVKKLSESHTDVGASLTNLGNAYRGLGDYERAESFYQRALASREKALGQDHPDVVSTLTNMALMQMARGSYAEASALHSRIIAVSERNADLNLLAGSERQKLAYLELLSEQINQAITLNVSLAPKHAAARDLAVTTALQRKGRVQDVLSDNLAAMRGRLSAADVELLDRFKKATSQLAGLVLGGPKLLKVEEHGKRIAALREERERLETEISRRSAEFRARSQPITLGAVRAALPENAALLEFVAYNRFVPKGATAKERRAELRYVVYVIRRRGDVQWRELGEAKAVDDAIDGWRQALRDPRRNDVKQLARALDERVLRPVRALAGDATQLLFSPDGALNLIPFEALVDEHDRYLIERYSVAYLTSGRDLLRMQVERASKGKPMVVANPSFGEPGLEKIASVAKPTTAGRGRRSVITGQDLSEVYFAPLGGTAREALTIRTLFPETSLLTGDQATESALKAVVAPRVLHIATHGFFLEDAGITAAGAQVTTRGIKANVKIENPLLRSGLALAGANRSAGVGDDGILTALEASGLNLWGTKLVVLSACDTGLGEVRNGEGVYGLRRAFVLAGAESLVMSMWPVSDYVTRELMTNYYKNLKKGLGRGESLRQVQLEMIKRPNRRHPFYWASFIQAGEWANLDGKR